MPFFDLSKTADRVKERKRQNEIKRQIDESYPDANQCIGINGSLSVPVLNQIESNKAILVTQWCKHIAQIYVPGESMMTLFH